MTDADLVPLQSLVHCIVSFLEKFDRFQIRYIGKQCQKIINALPAFTGALGKVRDLQL